MSGTSLRRIALAIAVAAPTSPIMSQATGAPNPKNGVLLVAGVTPLHARYVLTDTSQFLAGTPIAEDENAGMRLYRVNGLVRVVGRLTLNGSDPEDFLYAIRDARLGPVD